MKKDWKHKPNSQKSRGTSCGILAKLKKEQNKTPFLTLIQPGKGRFTLACMSPDYLHGSHSGLPGWMRVNNRKKAVDRKKLEKFQY